MAGSGPGDIASRVDPLIGWLFTDVAQLDLEAHVPVLTSFWETVLLGARSYGGGAFRPHAALHARVGLQGGHFDRWLVLWDGTVDELFRGERAEEAKAHAHRVADAFERRLGVHPSPERPPRADGSLPLTLHGPAPR